MIKHRKATKITFITSCILSFILLIGNIIVFGFLGVNFVSSAISGLGVTYGDAESAQLGASLVRKISEEGTVLLKNENNALPLDIDNNNKVNVFGYTSLDRAWVFTGVGSGSCKPDVEKRVGILKGLENAGFEYNHELSDKYDEAIPSSDDWMSMNQNGKIIQPNNSFYSEDLINQAKSFSSTAIVVLSRISGENVGEIPDKSIDYVSGQVDSTRNYLQISEKEEFMLNVVKDNFDKVIVILNTTNNMQCEFLDDGLIDAALYCGPTGLNGAEGVANVIAGRKIVKSTEEGIDDVIVEVSPSGRLADTYSKDYSIEPVYANRFVREKTATSGSIVYQEDIYFGYRWYETADEMGFFDGFTDGYDSVVMYPFGYGLSYTDFSWKVKNINIPNQSELNKDSKIEITVTVENIGQYPGKDVVQLYYHTPYYDGGIEKSSISLADFAKTVTLNPGEIQEVKLTVSAYDMASYDCYDKNDNGHSGYELDKGKYQIDLRTDVHHLKNMDDSNAFTYNISKTINYDKDPETGNYVINRFTGDDAYAGVAIDGSNVGINAVYLSRSDFFGTFTDRQASMPTDTTKVNKARIYTTGANNQENMPTFGVDKGMYIITNADGSKASLDQLNGKGELIFNDELIDKLVADYNDPAWNDFLGQLTKDEVRQLVEKSGFGSAAIESIGKVRTLDFDGPSGFNENTQKIAEDMSKWTSYPSECLVGCTWNKELANEIGRSIAFEADKSGISGWYAPGVNLHRTNYNGRNYEYYSEDPIISGKLAAATIAGAKSGGLYCYIKHFALSEEGDNAKGVDTWITEQNFRELYLKPFEIATKSGANAVMTAFNRIGPVWAGSNYDLLTEVLRNEWGFKGSVITDWSSGDEIMNTVRGVIAGNDMWLNPMERNYAPLDDSDATQMYCAKQAVKNNVYTYISTYQYMRDYDSSNDAYRVDKGVKIAGDIGDTWVTITIVIDIVVGLTAIASGVYLFGPWFKK